jgi:hypothetical protein
MVVMGTIGEPHSYLSDDQCEVYTDYPINDAVVLYYRYAPQTGGVPKPEEPPALAITELGGTVMVNGRQFTQKEPALPPLRPGIKGLFLLQHVGSKYVIAPAILPNHGSVGSSVCPELIPDNFYGAFRITDDRLMPLVAREDFAEEYAPEYRNAKVSDAIDTMMHILRAQQP